MGPSTMSQSERDEVEELLNLSSESLLYTSEEEDGDEDEELFITSDELEEIAPILNKPVAFFAKHYNFSDRELFTFLSLADRIGRRDRGGDKRLSEEEQDLKNYITGKCNKRCVDSSMVVNESRFESLLMYFYSTVDLPGLSNLTYSDFEERKLFPLMSFHYFMRLSEKSQWLVLESMLEAKTTRREIRGKKGEKIFRMIRHAEKRSRAEARQRKQDNRPPEDYEKGLEVLMFQTEEQIDNVLMDLETHLQEYAKRQEEPCENEDDEKKHHPVYDQVMGLSRVHHHERRNTCFEWNEKGMMTEPFIRYNHFPVIAHLVRLGFTMVDVFSHWYPIVGDEFGYFTHRHEIFNGADDFMRTVGFVTDKHKFLVEADRNKVFTGPPLSAYKNVYDLSLFSQKILPTNILQVWKMYQDLNAKVMKFTMMAAKLDLKPNLMDNFQDNTEFSESIRKDISTHLMGTLAPLAVAFADFWVLWVKSGFEGFIHSTFPFFEELRKRGYDRSRVLTQQKLAATLDEFDPVQKKEMMRQQSSLASGKKKGKSKRKFIPDFSNTNIFKQSPAIFESSPTTPYTEGVVNWKKYDTDGLNANSVQGASLSEDNSQRATEGCDSRNPFMIYDRLRVFVERVKTLIHYARSLPNVTTAVIRHLKLSGEGINKPVFVYYDNVELAQYHTQLLVPDEQPDHINEIPIPFPELEKDFMLSMFGSNRPLICVNRIFSQYFESQTESVKNIGSKNEEGVTSDSLRLERMIELIVNSPMLFVSSRYVDVRISKWRFEHFRRGTSDRLARIMNEYRARGVPPENGMIVVDLMLTDAVPIGDYAKIRSRFSKPSELFERYTEEHSTEENAASYEHCEVGDSCLHWIASKLPRVFSLVLSVIGNTTGHDKFKKYNLEQSMGFRSLKIANYLSTTSSRRHFDDSMNGETGDTVSRRKIIEFLVSDFGSESPSETTKNLNVRLFLKKNPKFDQSKYGQNAIGYQSFWLAHELLKLPVVRNGSSYNKKQRSSFAKHFYPRGQYLDEKFFLAQIVMDLGIVLNQFVSQVYAASDSKPYILDCETVGYLHCTQAQIDNMTPLALQGTKGIRAPQLPELDGIPSEVVAVLIKNALQLLIFDCGSLANYITTFPGTDPTALFDWHKNWTCAPSMYAINTIVSLSKVCTSFDSLRATIGDPTEGYALQATGWKLFCLLKMIDIYYRKGLPAHVIIQSCGETICNDEDVLEKISVEKIEALKRKIRKEGRKTKVEPREHSSIKAEVNGAEVVDRYVARSSEAQHILGLTNPSMKTRLVSLKGILGEKETVKVMEQGPDSLEDVGVQQMSRSLKEMPFFVLHSLALNRLSSQSSNKPSVPEDVADVGFREDHRLIQLVQKSFGPLDNGAWLADVDVSYSTSNHITEVLVKQNLALFAKLQLSGSIADDTETCAREFLSQKEIGAPVAILCESEWQFLQARIKYQVVAHRYDEFTGSEYFLKYVNSIGCYLEEPDSCLSHGLKVAQMVGYWEKAELASISGGDMLRYLFAMRLHRESREMLIDKRSAPTSTITIDGTVTRIRGKNCFFVAPDANLGYLCYSGAKRLVTHPLLEALIFKQMRLERRRKEEIAFEYKRADD